MNIEEKPHHQTYVDVTATTIKTWITETFECPIIELGKYTWLISKDGNNVAIGITLKSGSINENIWLVNPKNPIIFYDSYYQPLLFVPAKYNDPVTWESLEDLRDRLKLVGKAYNSTTDRYALQLEEKKKEYKAMRQFIDELKKLVVDNPELAAKTIGIKCADDILQKQIDCASRFTDDGAKRALDSEAVYKSLFATPELTFDASDPHNAALIEKAKSMKDKPIEINVVKSRPHNFKTYAGMFMHRPYEEIKKDLSEAAKIDNTKGKKEMKELKGFIRIMADECYSETEHNFTDTFEVVISIKHISHICEYIPEDLEWSGHAGIAITVDTGTTYIDMEHSIDNILEIIEDMR